MKYKIFKWTIMVCVLSISAIAHAQHVHGKVVSISETGEEIPIPFAKVKWKNQDGGAITDSLGNFGLHAQQLPDTLIIASVGYKTMAFSIVEGGMDYKINLNSATLLKGVVVQGKNLGKMIDLKDPMNIETIGSEELRKAACCNLSESFETNASVDVNITDAVSGAKKIQMLGLDGIYTQMQWENIPLVRGLSTSYGLMFTPGTWIESIQITKGTGSVVNGYETMAGLINLKIKQPADAEKLYVNVYGNKFSRAEINVHGAQHINDKWKTMTFIHGSNQFVETDVNNDGFKDDPVGFLLAGMNRWEYTGKNFETRFGIKATYMKKEGGQIGYQYSQDPINPKWGAKFETKHLEGFMKNGFFFKNRKFGSLGLIHQLKYHDMANVYGNTSYDGTQKKYYFNGIFSDIIKNTNHNYKTGLSFIVDNYNQTYNDSNFVKTEIVPGAFFEYTYNHMDKFIAVAGVRGDYHNLYGPLLAPRLHLKWNAGKKSALRLSVGRGFRVPNPYADYNSLMASNRQWIVDPNIQPEDAISSGLTYVQKFLIGDNVSSFSVDYFYTHFNNQLITDMDVDPGELHVYNTNATSYSHSVQTELNLQPIKNFDVRMAFKYYDVKAEFNGVLQQKAFVPKFRVLANVGYTTRNKKWSFDVTGNWVGRKRLPSTAANPIEYRRSDESVDYWLLSSQITYRLKRISFYVGGENLLNVIQNGAIISADDPFGSYFDATQLWAPIRGFNVYAGLHFELKHKKK
ncbi:TonB-dependent receptor [Paracrocinitomix mangrovi]|uniref:TonB-dependent receptor n=1 Tax=Paracrocinitomix mangrovi TaxID=2862509 RepID=UPI001C8DBC9E|nr:TonB-dependent receptor [Paracrocinitomix mangrovi]UKN02553.1 TonB-dependent receptor [Paracrocinitomix mangrovi]